MENSKIDKKYSHLALRQLPGTWSYYLCPSIDELGKAISLVEKQNASCCTFILPGEYSLVTNAKDLTIKETKKQEDWIGFKIEGEMPFGTVQGLIATISGSLKSAGVGVCVISTFLTDIFLVKPANFKLAKSVLEDSGWVIVNNEI